MAQGKITFFDPLTGQGVIDSKDDQQYRFVHQNPVIHLLENMPVNFEVLGEEPVARNVRPSYK